MIDLELKLPDEVMENIPAGSRDDVVKYLAKYFDSIIGEYDNRFQKRMSQSAILGGPLSKYEKSMLRDFLIDLTLGKLEEAPPMAAEALSTI